ncbi:SAF domain-containing protein [Streptomyces sp. NPDC001904]|uniref:SAF domain-containing protein n=1 Tax=Streptomyces sp. NPDC001904 TaxID=3154531 RepID=UPI003316A194
MSKSAAPAAPGQVPAQSAAPQPPSGPSVTFRSRRGRPSMYALAIALIAAGGGGGFLAFQATGERTSVLSVAHAVDAGDVIKDSDLVEDSVALGTVLKPYKASQREQVIGKRAAVALVPGALLSRGQVTTRTLVKSGERLVGIGLKAAQMPATRLSPGDRVLVVSAAPDATDSSGQPAETAEPKAVAARVVKTGPRQENTGEQVVDVAVPAEDATSLAARAQSGDVALVVDAPGDGN